MKKPTGFLFSISMTTAFAAAVLVAPLTTGFANPEEKAPAKQTPDPELSDLKTRLESIFAKHVPEARIEMEPHGETLRVNYSLREYMVHDLKQPKTVNPAFSESAEKRTGPSASGFRLYVSVLPGKQYMGARVMPSQFRQPYWITCLDDYPIKDRDAHLFMNLDYGLYLDKSLLKAIKEAVAAAAQ